MGFESDQSLANELKLFTENDGDIYHQQTSPILKNLATKKAQGKYDHDKAVTLFMYLTETGAKKYAREFGGPGAAWHEMFPIAVRRLVAAEWRDEFEVEFANGSYDNMLPKKYQRTNLAEAQTKRLATSGFYVGGRVELHPGMDAWMRGDKFGEVTKVGREKIHVKMDRSKRTLKIAPSRLTPVEKIRDQEWHL